MDSPVLTLIISLLIAFTVRSQEIADPQPHQPPEAPPPPSLLSPPSPHHHPPPSLLSPPSPHHHPPPPLMKPPSPAVRNGGSPKLNKHVGPRAGKAKTNLGKKIGLMFVGIASVLQVCILAFLLISRRLLFKAQNGYQRN